MSCSSTHIAIKEGEVNKGIYVYVGFNVNEAPFTIIRLNFTSPDGATKFSRSDPDVQAPTVDSPPIKNKDGIETVLPANNYVLYKTQAADEFTAGNWGVCFYYEDAEPSRFYGDEAILSIGESCN